MAKLTRVRTRKKNREVRLEIIDGAWRATREGRSTRWRFYDAYGLHLATESMREALARRVLHLLKRQYEAAKTDVQRGILQALGLDGVADRIAGLEQ